MKNNDYNNESIENNIYPATAQKNCDNSQGVPLCKEDKQKKSLHTARACQIEQNGVVISPTASVDSCARSYNYFAGANTADGFCNLFDQINEEAREGYLYILKGGPGSGKSTLMKTVGRAFGQMGFDIEYFYCSSDTSSLDGVRICKYNIAIVDGTAPHVTEAKMPRIREEIVNIGEFIGDSTKKHQKEIASILTKKSMYFDVAYQYLKNATSLYNIDRQIQASQKQRVATTLIARKIITSLRIKKCKEHAWYRRLYLSAIGGEGKIDFAERNQYSRVITLSYNALTNEQILACLENELTALGCGVTSFCNPLSPNSAEAIFIPCQNTLIKQVESTAVQRNAFLCSNRDSRSLALKNAAQAIHEAKKLHKRIESFYIPNMDFSAIDALTDRLIADIKRRMGI